MQAAGYPATNTEGKIPPDRFGGTRRNRKYTRKKLLPHVPQRLP